MSSDATSTLTIDGWRPARLNQYVGRHWSVGHRMKRTDNRTLWIATQAQQTPKAAGKRRISIHVVLSGRQKESDPDSMWKSLLDACVKCGLLVDDSPRYCELGPVTFARGKQTRTEITLEDLP